MDFDQGYQLGVSKNYEISRGGYECEKEMCKVVEKMGKFEFERIQILAKDLNWSQDLKQLLTSIK